MDKVSSITFVLTLIGIDFGSNSLAPNNNSHGININSAASMINSSHITNSVNLYLTKQKPLLDKRLTLNEIWECKESLKQLESNNKPVEYKN